MTAPRAAPSAFGERWTLPPPVRGVRVVRTPAAVVLSLPLPGRGAALARLGSLGATALVTLALALRAHPPQRLAAIGVALVAAVAALALAVAGPLAIVAALQRRRIILTEGVLLLKEGRRALSDCLRDQVRAVRLLPDAGRSTGTIEIEAAFSSIALRQAEAVFPEAGAGEEVVALLQLEGEPLPRARYLAEAIAAWAEVAVEPPPAAATDAGVVPLG